jgi:hypothetical protein
MNASSLSPALISLLQPTPGATIRRLPPLDEKPLPATTALIEAWRNRVDQLDRRLARSPNDNEAWQWRIRKKILQHLINRANRGAPIPQRPFSEDQVDSPLVRSADGPIRTTDRAPGIETGANSSHPPQGSSRIRGVLDRLQTVRQELDAARELELKARRERLRKSIFTPVPTQGRESPIYWFGSDPLFGDPEPAPPLGPIPPDPAPRRSFSTTDEMEALHRVIMKMEADRIMDIIDMEDQLSSHRFTDEQILAILNGKEVLELPEDLQFEDPD